MYYDTFKMINGDIYINPRTNDLTFVSGQEELRQNIENRLSVNKDEWFLNTELGLSYKDIRGKGVTNAEIGFAIRECTAQDGRIKSTEINIERNAESRYAAIKLRLTDRNGEQTETEVIEIG